MKKENVFFFRKGAKKAASATEILRFAGFIVAKIVSLYIKRFNGHNEYQS